MPETLDTFDIYLSLNDNIIKDVYLCDEISRYNARIIFEEKEINKLISMLNNLDYKAGIYPELCFCLGIENLFQIKPPKRSTYIRMLLCELSRINCHLSYIADMSLVLGNMTAFNYTLMYKEKILNGIEFITGSRIIPNFIRIGGVKKDIDENVLDWIYKLMPQTYKNIKKIEDIFSSDVIMLEKLKNSGIANSQAAKKSCVTGPNLRASGIRFDLRKTANYLLYKDIAFTIPLGKVGDNYDRVLIRFKEIYQSLKIISEIIETMPLGATNKMINPLNIELYPSRIISAVESPFGIFKLYIDIKENMDIEIIPVSSTKNNIILCEKTLIDCGFDELLPVVSSFGIESPEMY
jgi:NADH:ubiquinone oxidoreductase subunit D